MLLRKFALGVICMIGVWRPTMCSYTFSTNIYCILVEQYGGLSEIFDTFQAPFTALILTNESYKRSKRDVLCIATSWEIIRCENSLSIMFVRLLLEGKYSLQYRVVVKTVCLSSSLLWLFVIDSMQTNFTDNCINWMWEFDLAAYLSY
jgi:hypothetical protein